LTNDHTVLPAIALENLLGADRLAATSVHSVFAKHRTFAIVVSFAFAVLYAELGLFAHQAWRARDDGEATLLVASAFLLTFSAFLVSFVPAQAYHVPGAEQMGSLVLPELTAQMGKSVAIILLNALICLVMYVYLTAFDLIAATTLLN